MPILNDDTLERVALTQSHYGYSATRIDDLGATEYTLATVVCDVSGSTSAFVREMEAAVKRTVRACKYSPRADNLLLRVVRFDTAVDELHGFKLLETAHEADYDGALAPGGATALYDATINAVAATASYGAHLANHDFGANGIVFVITDGDDNSSTRTKASVRDALAAAVRDESLESLVSILVGVNVSDPRLSQFLMEFYKDAGFTQYVEMGDAQPETLARLANFVSRSIAAQSQALGTGGPSRSLVF
jgi:hypothetical protein